MVTHRCLLFQRSAYHNSLAASCWSAAEGLTSKFCKCKHTQAMTAVHILHVSLLGNAEGCGEIVSFSSDHWKRTCSGLPMTQTATDTGWLDFERASTDNYSLAYCMYTYTQAHAASLRSTQHCYCTLYFLSRPRETQRT